MLIKHQLVSSIFFIHKIIKSFGRIIQIKISFLYQIIFLCFKKKVKITQPKFEALISFSIAMSKHTRFYNLLTKHSISRCCLLPSASWYPFYWRVYRSLRDRERSLILISKRLNVAHISREIKASFNHSSKRSLIVMF